MLVVGSTALKAWDIPWRKPKDLDLIGTRAEFDAILSGKEPVVLRQVKGDKRVLTSGYDRIIEFEIAQNGNTAEQLLDIIGKDEMRGWIGSFCRYPFPLKDMFGVETVIASPDVLLTLKLSHRYLKNSPAFLKTMNDIIELRELGYTVPSELLTWLKTREKETYSYKHPSLMQGKDTFFSGDGVPYVYEHDDIHGAVKIMERPAYWYFQEDGAQVKVSKKKWNENCDDFIRLNSVLEESYVLALERCLIPNDFKIPPRRAFLKALEKVCTSITSGWWREYAWEHYHQAVGAYSLDYVEKFEHALATGQIRPYQGKANES